MAYATSWDILGERRYYPVRIRCCNTMTEPHSQGPVIAHLVHGTWPRGIAVHFFPWLGRLPARPRWHEPGSDFRTQFEACGIKCVAFDWSGNNSVQSRREAAERLRLVLAATHAKCANAKQFVIAHSHGGNVAVQALNERAIDSRFLAQGLATLGTPFLLMRVSQLGKVERFVIILAHVFALDLLVAPLRAFSIWDRLATHYNHLTSVSQLVAIITLYLVCTVAMGMVIFGWLASRERTLRSQTDHFRLPPTLILRAPGDEATVVLALVRLMNVVIERMWRIIRWVLTRVWWKYLEEPDDRPAATWQIAALVVFSFMLMGTLISVVLLLFSPHVGASISDSVEHTLGGNQYLVVLVVIAAPLTAGFFLVASCLIAADVMLMPFGWDLALCGLALEVDAEATPPGQSHRVELIVPGERERSSLSHGMHAVPSVRRRLLTWILEEASDDPSRQIAVNGK